MGFHPGLGHPAAGPQQFPRRPAQKETGAGRQGKEPPVQQAARAGGGHGVPVQAAGKQPAEKIDLALPAKQPAQDGVIFPDAKGQPSRQPKPQPKGRQSVREPQAAPPVKGFFRPFRRKGRQGRDGGAQRLRQPQKIVAAGLGLVLFPLGHRLPGNPHQLGHLFLGQTGLLPEGPDIFSQRHGHPSFCCQDSILFPL